MSQALQWSPSSLSEQELLELTTLSRRFSLCTVSFSGHYQLKEGFRYHNLHWVQVNSAGQICCCRLVAARLALRVQTDHWTVKLSLKVSVVYRIAVCTTKSRNCESNNRKGCDAWGEILENTANWWNESFVARWGYAESSQYVNDNAITIHVLTSGVHWYIDSALLIGVCMCQAYFVVVACIEYVVVAVLSCVYTYVHTCQLRL